VQGSDAQGLSELTWKRMTEVPQHGASGAGTPIECHRAADLVRWIAAAIEKMGGVTLIGEQQENLCRRANTQEISQYGGLEWIVEAQGLPNLIHEFVHALFLRGLADDHGFDYGEIPLDVDRPDHRALLWEELACCALSTSTCAPLVADPQGFARAWFTEQFEIQGVFHGLEGDLEQFRARVDSQIRAHGPELVETVERGRHLLDAALPPPATLIPPCDVLAIWADYLENCTGPKPAGHCGGRSRVRDGS
jgi:hypothetical protein